MITGPGFELGSLLQNPGSKLLLCAVFLFDSMNMENF